MQNQPVVGRRYAGRKLGCEVSVQEIVVEMGQVGLVSLYATSGCDGRVQMEMRRVGTPTNGVEDEGADALQ